MKLAADPAITVYTKIGRDFVQVWNDGHGLVVGNGGDESDIWTEPGNRSERIRKTVLYAVAA